MAQLIAGKYELLDEIGQRGAGISYRARDTKLDAMVVVTLLPAQLSEEQVARAENLAQRARELRHEHIAQVLDFGRDGDRHHVVEAFLEAEPLDRVLRDGKGVSPADALHIARQLADALAYAHERGVVHGGLTPASVQIEHLVPLRAVVSGFVAAAVSPGRDMPPAVLRYSAPERIQPPQDGAELDPRIDVFALGLLIYEMFEGKPFVAATEPAAIVELLLHGRSPLLPQFSRIVPSGTSALVARAIRRVPAERQQGMAQVRRDIDGCLGRLERARNDSTVVLDEALTGSPDAGPETEAPEGPVRETRRRVAAAREAAPGKTTREATVARRAAVPTRGKAHAQRGKIPIAAGGLVAVGLLAALGSLLLRPGRTRPIAADESLAHSRGRVEAAIPVPSPVADLDESAGPGTASAAEKLVPDAHPIRAFADASMRPGLSAARAATPRPRPRRNAAPRIVSFQPRRRGSLSVMEGTSLLFGVRGATEEPAHRLTYTWVLDGRRISRRPSWRFVAPPAATGTAHTVQVQVTDGAGPKGPRMAWHVDVFPRMVEVNVRDWLGRLAGAWERKDIATLRLYGIVTTDAEAAALEKRLSRYDHYRVAIGNETIRKAGRYASVAFDLIELDGCGKAISSHRESLELEKYPSGFIAVRAPK